MIKKLPQFLALLTVFAAVSALPASAIELPLLDDAFVLESSPTFNYGSHTLLSVNSATGARRYSFLHFDVHNSLPANTRADDIAQAFLYLYVDYATPAGKFAVHTVTGSLWGAGTVEGKQVGAASAGTITWTTANAVATTYYGTVDYTGSQIDEVIAIDVTAMVKAWLNGPASSNYGLALKPTGVTGETVFMHFDSKESATQSPPRLDVTLVKKRVAAAGDVLMGAFTTGPQP
jgi:hypothetical protein